MATCKERKEDVGICRGTWFIGRRIKKAERMPYWLQMKENIWVTFCYAQLKHCRGMFHATITKSREGYSRNTSPINQWGPVRVNYGALKRPGCRAALITCMPFSWHFFKLLDLEGCFHTIYTVSLPPITIGLLSHNSTCWAPDELQNGESLNSYPY